MNTQAALLLLAGFAAQLVLATHWSVTGPEALWWATGAASVLPPEPLWVRAPGLVLHLLAVALMLPFATHPRRFVVLAQCTPALGGVALFGTATGWASGLWGLALVATLHGGRGHAVAGALVGLGLGLGSDVASTLLVLPLVALVAIDDATRRTPWPWLGLLGTLLGVAAWGVDAPDARVAPGALVVRQLQWSAPLLGLAWGVALLRGPRDAVSTWARWLSVPVLLGAAVSAGVGWGTPAGAVAVAWWGAALLVARDDGPGGRLGEAGAWLAPVLALAIVAHVERSVAPLRPDPATPLWAGESLGDDAVRWAMPVGVPRHDPRAEQAVPILTDRPETAAWIRMQTGIPAVVADGCGPAPPIDGTEAVWVSWGEPTCTPTAWSLGALRPSVVHSPDGRAVGAWYWGRLTPR